MAKRTRHWLLKKRTWAGVAVAIGVVLGINFPEFWKGFGGGGPNPLGFGPSMVNAPGPTDTSAKRQPLSSVSMTTENDDETDQAVDRGSVVKVTIAERSLRLQTDDGDRPIDVTELVNLVKRATGDADGIRVRIYRKPSSRPSVESKLQSALTDAAIPENAILWVPAAND